MIPNLKAFYDSLRSAPFGGKIGTLQLQGMEAILKAWNERASREPLDTRWLAYILATAYHETGATMQPVRESFAKTDAMARINLHKRPYAREDKQTGEAYYGRGFVQLTWRTNYQDASVRYKVDLVNSPDLALGVELAAKIIVDGSIDGRFTGKPLSRYFSTREDDPKNARRVINGLDRAADIASYYHMFLDALLKGGMESPYKRTP